MKYKSNTRETNKTGIEKPRNVTMIEEQRVRVTLEYETNPESAVQSDDLLFHDPRAMEVKKDEKKLYYTVKKDGDFNTTLVTSESWSP